MSLIVKIISLSLTVPLTLSKPAAEKMQYFVHLSFTSTLKLINAISSDLQKLLKYFNDTAIVPFLKILFAPSATVVFNNLDSYSKDLNSSVFAISTLKLFASSLE